MFYETITISAVPAAFRAMQEALIDLFLDPARADRLLGCWRCEIGRLNRVVILRGFSSLSDLFEDRYALQSDERCRVPECGIESMLFEAWRPLADLPPILPGAFGPIYEIRTYVVRPGCLDNALMRFRNALPERLKCSALTVCMSALDGVPRFRHIWPYASLDARAEIRAEAVKAGIWPPKDSAGFFGDEMENCVMLPLPFSPLS
ncbi:NIPSNAP family protein [Gluconacetobacter asukensis]|uniref:NIPSNAP family protein n=1 Tax=Gluconacetobacter asukensis TaxID=1017181 RepID=A0A7W4J2P7_9PROT|nr:NIPSNAP family protein [Gluconacetobacter asukensis]MBB2173571.1 NIPSNAP family protein [Gluconacetobacter asukensis]